MIFGLFVLGVALTISAVAAYYSIAGLCAIFAAAVMPIIIMGAALELGKITATVWLHKYWHKANIQFKLYLIPAIIILMLITSMGIFGFLSKAHMDQNITVGDSAAQVQILDEKIKTEQDNISVNKKALQQMDAQVDQMLGRTTDDKGANRAVQIRKNQAKERKSLQADITAAQKNISALQAERAPLAAQNRKIEAEVGPIKYIAALIYGDNPDANLLERAVRWVIILLVFVFDPLALILILAAEQTIAWAREDKKKREGWEQVWQPKSEAWPEWDDTISDKQYEAIKQEANVDDDIAMTKFFDDGKELAKELDANDGILPKKHHNVENVNSVDLALAEEYAQAMAGGPGEEAKQVDAKFGSEEDMPPDPEKGDMYLRTDVIPNVLFKWNGLKWMEIPLTSTDSYVYNPEYIQDLIDRIAKGKYSIDWTTAAEQDQIQKVLHEQSKK